MLRYLPLHAIQLSGAVDLRQQDDEFIAPISACGVTHAKTGEQPVCHTFQDRVAGLVSKLVVYLLEIIQIDEEHAYLIVLPARLGHGLLESIHHQGSVRQSGKWVVPGKAACERDLTLEPLDPPAKLRDLFTWRADVA